VAGLTCNCCFQQRPREMLYALQHAESDGARPLKAMRLAFTNEGLNYADSQATPSRSDLERGCSLRVFIHPRR